MDFQYGEREERLRKEIREFVRENIPPDHRAGMAEEEHFDEVWEFSLSMSKKLSEKGWLTMTWPKEYGGMGASLWEQILYFEECRYWGIPGIEMGVSGTAWVGPSLMLFGTEEQKKKYLPLIAAGDPDGVWCTGYSEPDAGSDFASLQTRAERKGDEYIINGQKVWTSAAHRARWCWLAARTDPNAKKKHQGISIIIVDMKSEGITIRPLKNYLGFHYFNEIFFNNVSVPAENLVGQVNQGWSQLMQSLSFERAMVSGNVGAHRRILDELIQYAKGTGVMKKPHIRRQLAELAVEIEALKLLVYETAWKTEKEGFVVHEPSRDKALSDAVNEKIGKVGTEILGEFSQVDPLHKDSKWSRLKGSINNFYWSSPAIAIAGGTTDTQKNIVGQFRLKLPKAY
jgi:alkylation response protein AidB-like acyl-CoA dehydrogenase